jgi:hypothetical protein
MGAHSWEGDGSRICWCGIRHSDEDEQHKQVASYNPANVVRVRLEDGSKVKHSAALGIT